MLPALLAGSASGANKYWTGPGGTTNFPTTGTWQTGSPVVWSDGAVSTANAGWAGGDIAIFGGVDGNYGISVGSAISAAWSEQEQSSAARAAQQVIADLADGNAQYEQRFGFTYIVCATGKSAAEMLAILQRRLGNTRETELREAAEQQRQIMQIRLGKWLVE